MDGNSDSTVGYARDIRPLFREKDVESMRRARDFDLSSYADVAERAGGILAKLESGKMPCDGAWPAEQVALFRRWVDGGKQP